MVTKQQVSTAEQRREFLTSRREPVSPAEAGRSKNNVDRDQTVAYFLNFMSTKVTVDLGPRSYDILIGPGLLAELGALCKRLGLGGNCMVVSDSNVDPLYGEPARRSLKQAGFGTSRAVIPCGEESKSLEFLFEVYEIAVEKGMDRKSFFVALGGGVVGDLAGFAAATFLRGVKYVQAPTSLLAMVDSSVGGKTGVNLPAGKNLVGAFHQPSLVIADTDTLKTLAPREYVSGLAEVVKYGVIRDTGFFSQLESGRDRLLSRDADFPQSVIGRCCKIKADVVQLDERESGLRAILNFGHTLGHAHEKVTGYGLYLHGEAISIGMAFAARLSSQLKDFPSAEADRVVALLGGLGLPVKAPDCDWAAIREAMAVDKKSVGGSLRFVLAERIGSVVPGCDVPDPLLEEIWRSLL